MKVKSYDTVVLGGGSAGIAAAVQASRLGLKTLLIERAGMLGGMGTLAQVHTICGLYQITEEGLPQWGQQGIAREIGERVLKVSGQLGPTLMGKLWVIKHHPSDLAKIADEICIESSHLEVAFHAQCIGLKKTEQGWQVKVFAKGVVTQHEVLSIIDCTGDAAGARMIGSDFYEMAASERLYRPAYISLFTGVQKIEDELAFKMQLAAKLVWGIQQGKLHPACAGASLRASSYAGQYFMTIDLEAGKAGWNPFVLSSIAEVERQGRELTWMIWRFLRDEFNGFSQCPSPIFPQSAGVRESARYRGDTLLTGQDLIEHRDLGEIVASSFWPMEKRETAKGPKWTFFKDNLPGLIPVGCLRNRRLPGLYFAGRCISVDHDALASVRVMGTCMATGESAAQLTYLYLKN
jgi:hypothetical protein